MFGTRGLSKAAIRGNIRSIPLIKPVSPARSVCFPGESHVRIRLKTDSLPIVVVHCLSSYSIYQPEWSVTIESQLILAASISLGFVVRPIQFNVSRECCCTSDGKCHAIGRLPTSQHRRHPRENWIFERTRTRLWLGSISFYGMVD